MQRIALLTSVLFVFAISAAQAQTLTPATTTYEPESYIRHQEGSWSAGPNSIDGPSSYLQGEQSASAKGVSPAILAVEHDALPLAQPVASVTPEQGVQSAPVLFPNPAIPGRDVTLTLGAQTFGAATLYDIRGVEQARWDLSQTKQFSLVLPNVATGAYWISLTQPGKPPTLLPIRLER